MKLVAVSVVVILLIVGLLLTPQGAALDRQLVREAGDLGRAHPGLRSFMNLGSELGKREWVFAGLLVPAAFGPRAAWATVRLCAVGLAANQGAVTALKWAVNRQRPTGAHGRANSAFPSSHAAAAAGLAWVVAKRHRRLAPWAGLVALWIASSRVFLERHYPSDVLAGILLGILFAALALRLGGWLGASR